MVSIWKIILVDVKIIVVSICLVVTFTLFFFLLLIITLIIILLDNWLSVAYQSIIKAFNSLLYFIHHSFLLNLPLLNDKILEIKVPFQIEEIFKDDRAQSFEVLPLLVRKCPVKFEIWQSHHLELFLIDLILPYNLITIYT